MHLLKQCFLIDNQQEILIREERTDAMGHIVWECNVEEEPGVEKFYQYNSLGQKCVERELELGEEMHRCVIAYDANGNINSQDTFIGDELVQQSKISYSGASYINITYNSGQEYQKVVHTDSDGHGKTEIFEDGELNEVHTFEYDKTKRTVRVENLLTGQKEKIVIHYDEAGNEKLYQHYVNGFLQEEENKTWNDGRLFSESYHGKVSYRIDYEYNALGLLLSEKSFDGNGELYAKSKKIYNEQGRLIEIISEELNLSAKKWVEQEHLVFRYRDVSPQEFVC